MPDTAASPTDRLAGSFALAMCAADFGLPGSSVDVPSDILLLPPSGSATRDGRGPFYYDAAALAAQTNERIAAGGPVVIDYEHQLDDGQVRTGPVPAAGWLESVYAAADGLRGHVTWTPDAQALIAGGSYRGFSPTFVAETDSGRVIALVGGSLVNRPAFLSTWICSEQQASTTSEQQASTASEQASTANAPAADYTNDSAAEVGAGDTAMLEQLTAALALDAGADLAAVLAAIAALQASAAEAAGTATAAAAEVQTARAELNFAAAVKDIEVQTALAELTTATEQLGAARAEVLALKTAAAERAAVDAVDAAIRARKLTPAQREPMLAIARADLCRFSEAMDTAAPVVGDAPAATGTVETDPDTLTESEAAWCKQWSFSEDAMRAAKRAQRERESA